MLSACHSQSTPLLEADSGQDCDPSSETVAEEPHLGVPLLAFAYGLAHNRFVLILSASK